jgi:hypothetical protein
MNPNMTSSLTKAMFTWRNVFSNSLASSATLGVETDSAACAVSLPQPSASSSRSSRFPTVAAGLLAVSADTWGGTSHAVALSTTCPTVPASLNARKPGRRGAWPSCLAPSKYDRHLLAAREGVAVTVRMDDRHPCAAIVTAKPS